MNLSRLVGILATVAIVAVLVFTYMQLENTFSRPSSTNNRFLMTGTVNDSGLAMAPNPSMQKTDNFRSYNDTPHSISVSINGSWYVGSSVPLLAITNVANHAINITYSSSLPPNDILTYRLYVGYNAVPMKKYLYSLETVHNGTTSYMLANSTSSSASGSSFGLSNGTTLQKYANMDGQMLVNNQAISIPSNDTLHVFIGNMYFNGFGNTTATHISSEKYGYALLTV